MKQRIVLCSTMEVAIEVWRRAQRIPDVWVKAKRNPLSLTCINGVEYIFRARTEGQGALNDEIEVSTELSEKILNVIEQHIYEKEKELEEI